MKRNQTYEVLQVTDRHIIQSVSLTRDTAETPFPALKKFPPFFLSEATLPLPFLPLGRCLPRSAAMQESYDEEEEDLAAVLMAAFKPSTPEINSSVMAAVALIKYPFLTKGWTALQINNPSSTGRTKSVGHLTYRLLF